jgi:uncharacterized lipoprotein YajG
MKIAERTNMKIAKTNFALLFSLLASFALLGCVPGPQMLSIQPDVTIPSKTGAPEVTLGVEIIDALGSQKIGIAGDPNGDNFDITLTGDMASALAPTIQAGLENQGFKVIPPSAETPNVLTVEVQKIALSSTKEKIKYVTKLEVEIVAKARNGGLKYSRRYSVTAEKESASVSSSENSKLMLNSAVSDGISAMLNDEKLIETLKK